MFALLFAASVSRMARRPAIIQESMSNGFSCDICTILVDKIEDLLKDQKTEQEIADELSQYCSILGTKYQSNCVKLVQQYLPLIMIYLEKGIEHAQICTKLGYCDSMIQARNVQVTACDMCTKVVGTIEELLKNSYAEAEIAAYIAQLCDTIPFPVSTLCQVIVEKYIPIIIKWLESGMEHADICTKLGFCSTQGVTVVNGGGCDMCTKVVGTIEELLKNSYAEAEIAAYIAQLCDTIPFPVSTLCQVIVEKYIPIIIKWLESGMEHADICTKLGFCSKSIVAKPDNGLTCDVCKKIIAQVKRCLDDQKVESEIREYLDSLCETLPVPYSTLCKSVVDDHLVEIIKCIEAGMDHLQICAKLGYCATKSKARRPTI
ncbi:Saposin-like type B, region 1 family protein [Trichomonas vaginalis G3]|uniref:Saposin-like type B, region 1 family protein n=1 Tax=Trichomonas vaginalis (strain ATCC PRA-98 / G3) TaxID=412133 RepID=A2FN23_TRIV3|nr:ganglioside GM2 binding [Trichomonas vaginalis G3]EAX93694.1 Saposin-like type B, region 1 family protein [Trichomonas vaginalis G3]KAI5549833.1 ganglioside GM2 binding [Trichomonas vaginalis G3]|eukprot:XP_001306624.1 Saposin-like type B, region 1 family protein [Trichomonas vaginalis G3]